MVPGLAWQMVADGVVGYAGVVDYAVDRGARKVVPGA